MPKGKSQPTTADVHLFLAMGKWLPLVAVCSAVAGALTEVWDRGSWDLRWLIWPVIGFVAVGAIALITIAHRQKRRLTVAVVFISAWLQLLWIAGMSAFYAFPDFTYGLVWYLMTHLGMWVNVCVRFFLWLTVPVSHGAASVVFCLVSRSVHRPRTALVWMIASAALLVGYGFAYILWMEFEVFLQDYSLLLMRLSAWCGLIAFAAATILTRRARREVKQLIAHLCPSCSYDIRGIDAVVCPECAEPIDRPAQVPALA